LRSPLFDRIATLPNAILKGLTFVARFEFNERLLFVNRFTLLLDRTIELLLTADVIVKGSLSGDTARFFSLLLQSRKQVARTASDSCTSLLLLNLFKGIRVLCHLPLDSLDMLLCLSVLHSDAGENLPYFAQRVNFADVFSCTREVVHRQVCNLCLLSLVVRSVVDSTTV